MGWTVTEVGVSELEHNWSIIEEGVTTSEEGKIPIVDMGVAERGVAVGGVFVVTVNVAADDVCFCC